MIYYTYMKKTIVAKSSQPNLVLLRHGQSVWNKKGVFTGWTDIGLSPIGEREARRSGRLLRGLQFERAYTSVLKRAVKTLWLVAEEMDAFWLPIENSWRLNERHYGALQGRSKEQVAKQYGFEQFVKWRRGYTFRPPLAPAGWREGECLPEACGLQPRRFPRAESLKDTYDRVMPFWEKNIAPALARGERILVVAHGNSLRAIVKHLEGVSDAAIADIEIPTGVPLAYHITKAGKVRAKAYLR